MNKNVRIAKELVRLAKSFVAETYDGNHVVYDENDKVCWISCRMYLGRFFLGGEEGIKSNVSKMSESVKSNFSLFAGECEKRGFSIKKIDESPIFDPSSTMIEASMRLELLEGDSNSLFEIARSLGLQFSRS